MLGINLLMFLMLRLADETKDATLDALYKPERPVPRGLVHLKELQVLELCIAVALTAFHLIILPKMLLPFMVLLGYMALMRVEFFCGAWLEKRIVAYTVLHMWVLLFFDFYNSGFVWSQQLGILPPEVLLGFGGVSLVNGIVFELGRKISQPSEEREGVQSYSGLWGYPRALLYWKISLFLGVGAAAMALTVLGKGALPGTGLFTLLAILLSMGSPSGKAIELRSAVWCLCCYAGVGIVPFLSLLIERGTTP
jgi:4-hydroxybenzoate polyprenyltransferase